jgi:hypothetical protein
LIAVVVESDFCGYPQLQSKGLTFTTYRHTSYSYIRIASYKAMLTHESRIIRYRERRKKRLPPVVNNSWDIHRIRIFNGLAFQLLLFKTQSNLKKKPIFSRQSIFRTLKCWRYTSTIEAPFPASAGFVYVPLPSSAPRLRIH